MDRVGIGGLSLHAAGVAELERLKGSGEEAQDEFLRDLADALYASELVLLSTCNRVEVIFAREEGQSPCSDDLPLLASALGADPELHPGLRLVTGRNAIQHLFRVACSLDSVVQGEDQILGQVRTAFQRSESLGLIGPLLDPLFEGAFQVGKQVRTCTELSRHPVSIVSVGMTLLSARFPSANGRPHRAAVIGAGATGRLAAQALRDHGFEVRAIVNRSLGKAEELAAELGCQALSLQDFQRAEARGLGGLDALVSATGAPGQVLDRQRLATLAQAAGAGLGLMALDLALPRDLEVCQPGDGVQIIDLEEVQRGAEANKALRATAAREAEALVEQKLQSLERKQAQRRATDEISRFVRDSNEIMERELRGLSEGELASLPQATRDQVMYWARSALGRANHHSLAFGKRMARNRPDFSAMDEEETTG